MFRLAASLIPTMFSATRTTITTAPPMMSHGFVLQRLPEDREVVRDEERRDGDRDDVVEHLRPRRPERDELVEGVPREARRAAGLGVADGALGVGRRRAREDEARDQEDERRQPEREDGGDAERVVDRGADVAVRGREERRRPEDALELYLRACVYSARRDSTQPAGRSLSGMARPRARPVRARRRPRRTGRGSRAGKRAATGTDACRQGRQGRSAAMRCEGNSSMSGARAL